MSVEIAVEKVSPATAHNWLSGNMHNRHVRLSHVRRLAYAMKQGEWELNGETIKFNGAGDLIDGQHRLLAVIEADTTVEFVVVRGLEKIAQETVDQGAKRTFADVLRLRGVKDHNVMASTVRRVFLYEHTGRLQAEGAAWLSEMTTQALVDRYEQDAEEFDAVLIETRAWYRKRIYLGLPFSLISSFMYLAEQKAGADQVIEFLNQVGHSGPDRIPAMLHDRLAKDRAGRDPMPMRVRAALLVKAWNAWLHGVDLRTLVYRAGGKNREPFPQVLGPADPLVDESGGEKEAGD